MRANHQRRRPNHVLLIQRIRVVINVAGQERRADFITINAVAIGFCRSRLARVKVLRCRFNGKDANTFRQHII